MTLEYLTLMDIVTQEIIVMMDVFVIERLPSCFDHTQERPHSISRVEMHEFENQRELFTVQLGPLYECIMATLYGMPYFMPPFLKRFFNLINSCKQIEISVVKVID
jgi:hypothetical protein